MLNLDDGLLRALALSFTNKFFFRELVERAQEFSKPKEEREDKEEAVNLSFSFRTPSTS